MSSNFFYILNILLYIISLKIFLVIFKLNYKFPFRYADLFAFTFNIIFFVSFGYFLYGAGTAIAILFINLNLFYIFFHLINMIITSPRTKIILDLMESKNNKINFRKYSQKYNYKIMVKNRIRRLKTNNQILFKNNKITLKKNEFNFFSLISFVFRTIEKF